MTLSPFSMLRPDQMRAILSRFIGSHPAEQDIFELQPFQSSPTFPPLSTLLHPLTTPNKSMLDALMSWSTSTVRGGSSMLTSCDRNDQMMKAYSLFASILARKTQTSTSSFSRLNFSLPDANLSAFTRPKASGDHVKRTSKCTSTLTKSLRRGALKLQRKSGSFFRRGERVHLANGSSQRVECLQVDDFLKSWTAQQDKFSAAMGLYWATVEQIAEQKNPSFLPANQKEIRICFRVQSCAVREDPRQSIPSNKRNDPIYNVFEHICSVEQPFFVRSFGWSAGEPQFAHHFCGIICRQLEIHDVCLVLIAESPSPGLLPASPSLSLPPHQPIQSSGLPTDHLPFCPLDLNSAYRSDDLPVVPPSAPPIDSHMKKMLLDALYQKSLSVFKATVHREKFEFDIFPESSRPERADSKGLIAMKKEDQEQQQPLGRVPNYFSAASLAESPFNSK